TILGEPIGSTILAVIFLSELPRQWQLVGSAIILCALLIASVEEARATRRASSQRQQAVAT
ncbi:MAG: EamA/RhaT family transporter, partial [Anaerolineae bacterium]|nr:EamA/RhaT family transporter [Anaerolineae bacterium]